MTSLRNASDSNADRARAWFWALALTAGGVASCLVAAKVAWAPEVAAPSSASAGNTVANRVHVAGGTLRVSPNDWEALGKVAPVDALVGSFTIDRYEVTTKQWAACGDCPQRDPSPQDDTPQTNVTPAEAQHFCETVGGRLPTANEWTFAASSAEGYRYPWGHTGLVCRKAVYGMVNGPCAEGATRPSQVGAHELGATPSGIFDLCGNAAEWVTDSPVTYAVGGSFRSTLAGQLKVWAREQTATPRDDIGFRCVYTP